MCIRDRVCIKPNRLKVSPAQWDSWRADQAGRLRPAPLAGDGYYWKGVPAQEPAFNEGWFTVQGEASQLAARLVEARPGQKILDLCAAPGGKSCAMAIDCLLYTSSAIWLDGKGKQACGIASVRFLFVG